MNAFPFDAETLLAARPKSRRNSTAGRDRPKNFFAHCRLGGARYNELKGRQLGADDYVTKPIAFDMQPVAAFSTASVRVASCPIEP